MATVSKNEVVTGTDEQTKPPFLRRVQIRGYKSIAFCDVTLEPLTILVGRNASGKSNFIDALAFLRDAMAINISEATKRHGGWQSILSRFSFSGEISFEVEVSLPARAQPASITPGETRPHATYGFLLKEGPSSNVPVLIQEWFRMQEGSSDDRSHYNLIGTYDPARESVTYNWNNFVHPQINCSQLPYPRPDHLWIGLFGKPPFTDVIDGLRFSAYYNFVPEAMRRPQLAASGQPLDPNGWNLASVLDSTQQYDNWAFRRIGSYLSAVVSEIERFDVVRYGDYETIRFRLGFNGHEKKLDFDASSMSDGTLQVLAALTAAFQSLLPWGCPSVVGIEEPESALHPAAMRALVAALDEASLRTQILLTTHSPDLLDAAEIKPANVRVVQMIAGQTVIGPVDEASIEIVDRMLNSLGGLERENQLEPDLDDQERQRRLAHAQREDRP